MFCVNADSYRGRGDISVLCDCGESLFIGENASVERRLTRLKNPFFSVFVDACVFKCNAMHTDKNPFFFSYM